MKNELDVCGCAKSPGSDRRVWLLSEVWFDGLIETHFGALLAGLKSVCKLINFGDKF